MVDGTIKDIVIRYLKSVEENGVAVSFGIVFGSQATGKARVWSDIDLLVVSPHFDGVRRRDDVNLLWRLAARSDCRIEPIPCGERQWSEDDVSPIIEIARREGEEVPLHR
mgnify:CR=1 FL=1